MKAFTVRSTLMATLLAFTLMLVVGAVLGMYALHRANQGFAQARVIAGATQDANDIYKDTARARAALMRAYAEAKENAMQPSATEHLASAQKYHERSQKELQAFIIASNADSTNVRLRQDFIRAVTTLSRTLERAMSALRSDDLAAFTSINVEDITPQGAAVSNLLERFQQESNLLGQNLSKQREAEYRSVEALVGCGIILALLLAAAIHVFLKRSVLIPLENAIVALDRVAKGDLTGPVQTAGNTEVGRLMHCIAHMQGSLVDTVLDVRKSARSIDRVAHEVTIGNVDLSTRTESQASSLEETAAALEELTSTVQQTTESTQKARRLVRGACDTTVASSNVMGRMVETMAHIEDSSRRVNDIIAVIDGIAFQTNVLALNAAVEAARAGDHGRGFAVVANEVRSLAQQSAVAAKEVKALIEDAVGKVGAGSELAQQVQATMGELTASVQEVAGIVIGIAEASEEQSRGLLQINEAITQMDDVTQRNAALVEHAALSSQSMNDETKRLIDAVGVFRCGSIG